MARGLFHSLRCFARLIWFWTPVCWYQSLARWGSALTLKVSLLSRPNQHWKKSHLQLATWSVGEPHDGWTPRWEWLAEVVHLEVARRLQKVVLLASEADFFCVDFENCWLTWKGNVFARKKQSINFFPTFGICLIRSCFPTTFQLCFDIQIKSFHWLPFDAFAHCSWFEVRL